MARSGRPRRHQRVREAAASRYATEPAGRLTGVLYDSDVIIEILRGRAGIVAAARELEERGVPTYCSAISWAEIYAGIRAGEEPPTAAFFEARGEVVLDSGVGRLAGSYLARFARSHRLQLGDALVAAAAVASGLTLWTLNRKHYPMSDLHLYQAP